MIYKLILFFLGALLIFLGRVFIISHWPYGRLIYLSGLILCATMIGLLLFRMVSRKRNG